MIYWNGEISGYSVSATRLPLLEGWEGVQHTELALLKAFRIFYYFSLFSFNNPTTATNAHLLSYLPH